MISETTAPGSSRGLPTSSSRSTPSISRSEAPGRPGNETGTALDRREQRKHDQALGLVPFAAKLDSELVKQLQALAQTRQMGLNEVVAELLKKGLGM